MALALNTLKFNNVAHRDLKPDNFILSDSLEFYIIADFGMSCSPENEESKLEKYLGTENYLAKEVAQYSA